MCCAIKLNIYNFTFLNQYLYKNTYQLMKFFVLIQKIIIVVTIYFMCLSPPTQIQFTLCVSSPLLPIPYLTRKVVLSSFNILLHEVAGSHVHNHLQQVQGHP